MPTRLQVTEAYKVLGLQEGAPLEVVKSTYKQVALRKHPDKNVDKTKEATEEFQALAHSYSILRNHLAGNGEYDDDYVESNYDNFDLDDLEIFVFIDLSTFLGGNRSTRRNQFTRRTETSKERREREHRDRVVQATERERLCKLAKSRKEREARDREKEIQEKESRQKAKLESKKAQAEAQRTEAAEKARKQRQIKQSLRSAAFAAAKSGDAEKVIKAVWEDLVDAAGGEIALGCEEFAKPLQDPLETLLHISCFLGNLDLVIWLESHSAELDEKDSRGLTPFHIALRSGHINIILHFFKVYPPNNREYRAYYEPPEGQSLLFLAVESGEPELVWMVIENKLASLDVIYKAWAWATSKPGIKVIKKADDSENYEDILKLLLRYGEFTPPSTPVEKPHPQEWKNKPGYNKATDAQHAQPAALNGAFTNNNSLRPPKQNGFRARGRRRGRGQGSIRNLNAQQA